jgi:ComF family protein
VPLHWTRLVRRGYDQAELLAAEVSRRTGAPLLRGVLSRERRTKPQSGLDASRRKGNVTGVFRLRSPGRVRNRHIVLIDDLVTTGETVLDCCRALSVGPILSVTVLCGGRSGTLEKIGLNALDGL